jgi:hypothetical protein
MKKNLKRELVGLYFGHGAVPPKYPSQSTHTCAAGGVGFPGINPVLSTSIITELVLKINLLTLRTQQHLQKIPTKLLSSHLLTK